MEKPGFRERFRYWFDNRMARGSVSMIKMLCLATVAVVMLTAGLILLFGHADNAFSAFWDVLATTINAWMPYSEDGDTGYVVLTALAAVAGLLVTSVLIGIVGTAMEEKISELRKGSSRVLEEGHTVVLGFTDGAYTLIRELVRAAAEEKRCIVVAGAGEKDEIEDSIRANVEIPKNVRVICRSADVTNPAALACCAIETAETVVVAPGEDGLTVKTVLAVRALLKEKGAAGPQLVAAVSRNESLLPASFCRENRIWMLQSNDVIARIIAHSCTQPGLSRAVTDIFNFEGAEFYYEPFPPAAGLSFAAITARLDGGVPLGMETEKGLRLRPAPEELFPAGKRLLFFAEERDTVRLLPGEAPGIIRESAAGADRRESSLLVLGYNDALATILRELPKNIRRLTLAGVTPAQASAAARVAAEKKRPLRIAAENPAVPTGLAALVGDAEHVVLLSDHELPEEKADVVTMLRLLQLRSLKRKRKLDFTITAEMRKESNRLLVAEEDLTDFVVASDMTSMVLAQLAEEPLLGPAFRELLSDRGSELFLIPAALPGTEGGLSVRELRLQMLSRGYLVLGILQGDTGRLRLNPGLEEHIVPGPQDSLIVIGEL